MIESKKPKNLDELEKYPAGTIVDVTGKGQRIYLGNDGEGMLGFLGRGRKRIAFGLFGSREVISLTWVDEGDVTVRGEVQIANYRANTSTVDPSRPNYRYFANKLSEAKL